MKPLIYVTQALHEDATELLRAESELVLGYGSDAVPIEEVIAEVEGYVVRFAGIGECAIRDAPKLRAISRAGVGYESIPLDAARKRGVPVYVPIGVNAQSVAEMVFALALSVARDLPHWEALARSGREDMLTLRETDLGMELSGKRLGLVGVGSIGHAVARIGREGFGMRVAAYHPRRTDEQLREMGIEPAATLEELLSTSDVVTVHVPLTDETRGMIGAEQFAIMPERSILVNVARGGIVDEKALAAALESGRPGGAGMDVWETKMPRLDNPLLSSRRLVVSPHRAGRTDEAQRRAGVAAARALLDSLQGRPVHDVVDVTA